MNFQQALIFEQTITAKRFWIISKSGSSIHLYECKAEKRFGTWGHKRRFAGWLDSYNYGKNRYYKPIRCSTKNKKWESFWLASELTRTDWKIQIISDEIRELLCQKINYK